MKRNICHFAWDGTVRANLSCSPHSHQYVEVVYSDLARGRLFQDGRVYPYEDQSVFVYQPGGTHWVENETPGHHICVLLETEWSHLLIPGVYTAVPQLRRHFMEVREYHERTEKWQLNRMNMLAGLICCDLLDLADESSSHKKLTRPEHIRNYIDNNLGLPLKLDELAAMACVHKDYLRQLFRDAFDESLCNYIIRKRMERAAELLRYSEDKVSVIGSEVGIDNEFYFSRLFKKTYGLSPSAYRKRHGRQTPSS
ncbi:AraC family transcriptional regulator [Ruficoccus sp. ZRK36]|uniref:helix-turn-helix transcriptional regulator n=1 Tax=Ruficoccus sp. ZRK36 TaxID=2866311 RepID=UPI001C73100F|nr:AraC family transcriptional regulator [Ruficoccus sp. ZRK36]QYY35275.1 AraC family transcriptional regulator [Ruficoccus sp. ZRK36]